MYPIRRSCQSALQSSRYVCLYAGSSRRAFSQSPAHSRGALPNFLPPSSPELSALLSTFNSKVLLPYHLTKEQQKLVYSEESRPKIEAEPVEITLGDVTLPLEHLDRNRLPNRWQTFRQVVQNSESKEDWENVVRCVEGFVEAGIEVKTQWQEMVVRKLNDAGMHHLVLKMLQRPKASGIRLSNRGVVTEVLTGLHNRAAMAGWEQEETTKVLKMARQVVELMENPEHHASQSAATAATTNGKGDWRGHPVVVALPTSLAAVVAQKHGGDKDYVRKMANRLVAAIKQSDYMTSLDALSQLSTKTSADFKNIPTHMSFATKFCEELLELIIIWNALKTSRKILGGDMPMANEAQQYESRADQVLMQSVGNFDTLLSRNGTSLSLRYADVVNEIVEKCR